VWQTVGQTVGRSDGQTESIIAKTALCIASYADALSKTKTNSQLSFNFLSLSRSTFATKVMVKRKVSLFHFHLYYYCSLYLLTKLGMPIWIIEWREIITDYQKPEASVSLGQIHPLFGRHIIAAIEFISRIERELHYFDLLWICCTIKTTRFQNPVCA